MSEIVREPEQAQEPKRQSLAHRLYSGDLSFDFMRTRKWWYLLSAALMVIAVASLAFNGLRLGLEFQGGTEFQAPVRVTDQTVPEVREAVANLGVPNLDGATVLTAGSSSVRVQLRSLNPDELSAVRSGIAKTVGAAEDEVTYSQIGSTWGHDVTRQALTGLVVFVVLVMALILVYFRDWRMSVSALVALIHDLMLTVGVYSIVGFTVSPATLIGVLTILGYSLYDTVVVFDKVRENVTGLDRGDKTYSEASNHAINQVLVRSLNTTVIGVLPVTALLVAGTVWLQGGPLEDLGLALFVGMITGVYSSLFLAAPLAAQLKEISPSQKAHREQLERRRARERKRVEAEASGEAERPKAEAEAPKSQTVRTGRRDQPRTGGSRAERKAKRK